MSKRQTMIIDKEMKQYALIKGIFSILDKDENSIVYLNNNKLYYYTSFASGALEAEINSVSIFSEFEQNSEYELSKITGKKFKLAIKENDADKSATYKHLQEINEPGIYLYSVDDNEFGVVSRIAIKSNKCVSDECAKSISKFGHADIYVKDDVVSLVKRKTEDQHYTRIQETYFCYDINDLEKEREHRLNESI